MTDSIVDLVAMREEIQKAWCKENFGAIDPPKDNRKHGVCLLGAAQRVGRQQGYSAAETAVKASRLLGPVIQELFPKRWGGAGDNTYSGVMSFNDHWKTRKADVLVVLDKAIANQPASVTFEGSEK